MRVLQIHNLHSFRGGGAEEVIEQERAILAADGHDVCQYLHEPTVTTASALKAGMSSVWNRTAGRRVTEALAADVDLVHVHTPFPSLSFAPIRAALRSGLPVATSVHAYRYSCLDATLTRNGRECYACLGLTIKGPGIARGCYHDSRLASAALAAGTAVHLLAWRRGMIPHAFSALGEPMARSLELEGVPRDRILVRPNAVERSDASQSVRHDQFVFVGRLRAEKGILTVLAAWERDPTLPPLLVVGDGPLRTAVVDASNKDRRIRLLGWLDRKGVSAAVASSKALIFASVWFEASPLVLLEALALGTPVVYSSFSALASPIGPFSDAASDSCGSAFRPGDAGSLVDALHEIPTSQSDAWWSMSAAATHRWNERYSTHVARTSLYQLYDLATDIRHNEGRT